MCDGEKVRHAWIYGGVCEIRPPVYTLLSPLLSHPQVHNKNLQKSEMYSSLVHKTLSPQSGYMNSATGMRVTRRVSSKTCYLWFISMGKGEITMKGEGRGGKFRWDQLHSHIWGRASSYMINTQTFKHTYEEAVSAYKTFQPIPSEYPYTWGKFD